VASCRVLATDVTLDVAAFNTDAATHLPGDATQPTRVATQSASPGKQRAGATVLISDLTKAQELSFAGHGGTVGRLGANTLSEPLITHACLFSMTFG
jgi:hypothetical protein